MSCDEKKAKPVVRGPQRLRTRGPEHVLRPTTTALSGHLNSCVSGLEALSMSCDGLVLVARTGAVDQVSGLEALSMSCDGP